MKAQLIVLISFLILTPLLKLNGQNIDFLPASPNVAELGKYGKMPISYYTGQPNIGIPLYTLKCGMLELPISLSYSASGIKVDQVASWVGLGWSLNAGGIIQRSKVGEDDLEQGLVQNILGIDFTTNTVTGSILDEPRYLAQQDIYSFNFYGYSGQFIFDKDRSIHLLKCDSKLKISAQTTPVTVGAMENTVFTIVDNSGVTFKFDKNEYTSTLSQGYVYRMLQDKDNIGKGLFNQDPPSGSGGQTGWFITEIIAPNGFDKITFEYDNETIETTSKLSGSLIYRNDIYTGWYADGEQPWSPCGTNFFEQGSCSFFKSISKNETRRLKRIIASNGTSIDLLSSVIREDVENAQTNNNTRLDGLRVSFNSNLVKKWVFDYSYFNSYIGDTPLSKRLRLASVQELSQEVKPNPLKASDPRPYAFHYFGDDAGENGMPMRNCYAGSDYFGYCNKPVTIAESNNIKNIFPKLQGVSIPSTPCEAGTELHVTHYNSSSDYVSFTEGSIKQSNIDYAKAYTLKGIDYPLGGKTLFEYELHDYAYMACGFTDESKQDLKNIGGLRIKKITDISNTGVPEEREFLYLTKEGGKSGVIMDYPVYCHPFRYSTSCTAGGVPLKLDVIKLESQPVNSLFSLTGESIGYKSVIEKVKGQGQTIYTYYSGDEFPSEYKTLYAGFFYNAVNFQTFISHPFYPFNNGLVSDDYARGLPKEILRFHENGDTLSKEIYEYNFNSGPNIFSNQFESGPGEANSRVNIYYYKIGYSQLKSKRVEEYSSGVVNTKIYDYGYTALNLLSQESLTLSDGSKKINSTKYVSDLGLTSNSSTSDARVKNIIGLLGKGVVNEVIEQTTLKEIGSSRAVVNSTLKLFGKYGNYYYPDVNYVTNNSSLLTNFSPAQVNSSGNLVYSSSYDLNQTIDAYDSEGHILQYHDKNNLYTSILWNSILDLPIAKIDNAQINQVAYSSFESPYSGTSSFIDGNWSGAQGPTWASYTGAQEGTYCIGTTSSGAILSTTNALPAGKYKLSFFAQLATANTSSISFVTTSQVSSSVTSFSGLQYMSWKLFESEVTITSPTVVKLLLTNVMIDGLRIYPIDAQMTTYTYNPTLKILSSQSDANSFVTKYEYDSFGRLLRIKDSDGKILKEFEYNYSH